MVMMQIFLSILTPQIDIYLSQQTGVFYPKGGNLSDSLDHGNTFTYCFNQSFPIFIIKNTYLNLSAPDSLQS